MEDLLINEGGQPVFLEDLSLIQSESIAACASLITAMTSADVLLLRELNQEVVDQDGTTITAMTSADALLLRELNQEVVDQDGTTSVTIRIPANTLVYHGRCYPFAAADVVVKLDGTQEEAAEAIHVSLYADDTDYRTFSDGRQRPTRRVYTVRISTDAGAGSLASWSVLELPNLREEMRKFLGL